MRNDKERIVDRRVLPGQQATAQMGVYARPVDISTAAPQGELAALMNGLNAFTGSVVRKQDAQDKFDAKEAELSGALAGQMEQDPNATVAGYYPTRDLPAAVNPAFKEHFDVAYRSNVAARVAASANDRFLAEYEKNRFSEGFNAQQFLQESRSKEMAGVTDPLVQGAVLKAHEDAAKVILGDQRQIAFKRLVSTETENINQMVSSSLPADLLSSDPQAARMAINGIQEQARRTGLVTTQQVSEIVTHHAVSQAIKFGDPRYLDVLEAKDPKTGMSLVDMNQQLKHSVESARKTAQGVFDKKMDESMQGEHAAYVMQLRSDAEQGKLPNFTELRERVLGKGKMYQQMEGYLSLVEDLRRRAAGVEDLSATVAMINAGQAHNINDPALLKRAMAQITAPITSNIIKAHDAFTQAPTAANEQAVLTLYSQLTSAYAKTKEAPPQLKALFSGVANELLSGDGQPTANLRIAQKLYGSMTPGQRESMLDDSSKEFMSLYVAGLDDGVTPVAALRKAKEGMSPEGKALAAKLKEDTTLQGRLNEQIRSMQSNTLFSWASTHMGFIADNSKNGNVFEDVKLHVMQRARMDPVVGSRKGQLDEWAKSYLERNYVKDPVSNMLIKTTTSGMDSGTMGKVLEYQHAQWKERPDLKHVYADGGFVVVTPTRGDTFVAESYTKDGIKLGLVGEFKAGEVSRSMSLTSPDGKPTESARLLGEFRQMQRDGKLTREYLDKNAAGLANLRVQGHLDSGVLSDVTAKMATAEAISGPKSIPKFSIGKPDPTKFETPASGFARGDTLQAAQSFATAGRTGLALTATREGFVATVKPDPNKDAGNNIGFGYNLKSKSAEQIRTDFKAAGIPPERVQDIVDGKAAITLDQGMKLLEVTHRRYAADAAANYPHGPNKWALLPQNIRDVLTDIHYQTGNVSQFKQAIKYLEAGDVGQLNEMLKVNYRKDKDSPLLPDNRGNNIRAHLLESQETFKAALTQAAKRPSTKLDSLASR